jgi:hypothetical protein
MKSQKEIEESFHAGQTRILEMVVSDAPLPEILKSVVLLMEAQADGIMLTTHSGEITGSSRRYSGTGRKTCRITARAFASACPRHANNKARLHE